MTEQQCNGIFISHATEDKEHIVEPFINCLEEAGISDIWYDKNQIEEGQSIIRKINNGLKNSKIGIVIITPHFLKKFFATWELDTLTYLNIKRKIRLIPLYKDITVDEILNDNILLTPLRFVELSNDCDPKLIEHIRNHLEMGNTLIDNPNNHEFIIDQEPKITYPVIKTLTIKFNIEKIDIDRDTIASIYNEIKTGSQIIKELNIKKIKTIVTNRRVWVHKETWDLIEYLIFSDNIEDVKDGIYILGEMVKVAKLQQELYISKNVEELFFFKLLDLSDPLKGKYISQDTLNILEIILEPSLFFNICISVLTKAIEDIPEEQKYIEYIQFFHHKIKVHINSDNIVPLINRLENIIKKSKKEITKERAKNFVELIVSDYRHLL